VPSLVTPAVPAGSLASMNQPGIAGSDILLRPWQPADQEAVVTAFTDPAIQQWHARSVTEAEAQDWIAQWPRRWQSESAASWAVIDGGMVAGQIGLRRIDLDEGLASISYWVLPEARGRRLAPRALTVLTTWAFEDLGLHRLELSHSTANAASCRVAQRCGYLPEGTKRSEALHADGWHDMHAHARLATDPPALW
jgi:RimJ/RimL family protein N-acetyltransferase